VQFNLPVSQEILNEVARFDRFQGSWSAQHTIPVERLSRLRAAAHVQSVAASCRLAGIRVSDADVASLIHGDGLPLSDSDEILGYSQALAAELPADGTLLTGEHLRPLHARMLHSHQDVEPSPWRTEPLYREAFDAGGHATGRVFSTLPPRFVQRKTEELLTWLEFELRSRERHPVLVIGAFTLLLASICPFERANGRFTRLVANLLLRRAGYSAIPYASLEAQMEELREDYHAGVSGSQTRLWTDEADLQPWLEFFVRVLGRHRERVEAKMALERRVQDYPPLQRAILETIREHGSVDAALLLQATGANRNTLKDNLRRMVQKGVLNKTGERRGTRYHMPTSEPAAAQPLSTSSTADRT
jgi:Fic family protein